MYIYRVHCMNFGIEFTDAIHRFNYMVRNLNCRHLIHVYHASPGICSVDLSGDWGFFFFGGGGGGGI